MLSTTFLTIGALAAGVNAHFRLLQPTWRGSSFVEPASQWIYPCANVNETTDIANRTLWPSTGGSLIINGSHEHALTAVNLALGSNVTNFNISLVELFNQTGAGIFCLKETGKANLDAGFKAAGYSGASDPRIEGLQASIQIIQLGHSGSALYNCADIRFNSTAQLLSDDVCKNGTGVGGIAIENVDASSASTSPSPSGSSPPAASTGAASVVGPVTGGGLLVAMVAWGLFSMRQVYDSKNMIVGSANEPMGIFDAGVHSKDVDSEVYLCSGYTQWTIGIRVLARKIVKVLHRCLISFP
ncbi:hypothetical protein IQ07DRAFT_604708 [Pyrenochaeta sp. DS3sAY3a]|nr:hypothetical protein IQ07DRAFT_604708 [Pyrenochaeta sp. DS3sAY3a]